MIENNQRSAVAMVVEPGIRVLYIEGTLRAEYGAIVQRFLSVDPDLEFCSLVQTKKNVFLKRTNMQNLEFNAIPNKAEDINKFDVFIIGDLDSSYLRSEQQELIVKRVQEGGGLVMLGGYHSLGPGGYEGTPIGKALPVRLGTREAGQVSDPFLPLLTPDGAASPIFANILGFFPTSAHGAEDRRLADAQRLHQSGRAASRRDCVGHPSDRRKQHAGPGDPAGGQRADCGLHRRYHPQLAAGAAGAGSAIAVPAILGANGALVGRPCRGRGEQGEHHRVHRQTLLRAGRHGAAHRRGARPEGGRRERCGGDGQDHPAGRPPGQGRLPAPAVRAGITAAASSRANRAATRSRWKPRWATNW